MLCLSYVETQNFFSSSNFRDPKKISGKKRTEKKRNRSLKKGRTTQSRDTQQKAKPTRQVESSEVKSLWYTSNSVTQIIRAYPPFLFQTAPEQKL